GGWINPLPLTDGLGATSALHSRCYLIHLSLVANVVVCHALAKAASGISVTVKLADADQRDRNGKGPSSPGHTGMQHDGTSRKQGDGHDAAQIGGGNALLKAPPKPCRYGLSRRDRCPNGKVDTAE